MNISRRSFLAFTACAAFGYGRCIEPRLLACTEKTVPLGPAAQAPIRLLHLSDFHWSTVVSLSFIDHAVELGLAMQPDLICLTGDFVTDGSMPLERYLPVLKKLSAAVPTFACLGNHDGGTWSDDRQGYASIDEISNLLVSSGIRLLRNDSERIQVGERILTIVGVGDLWSNDVRADEAFRGVASQPDIATILLAHNPDTKELVAGYPWRLMLSGHTHGGQFIVPFLDAAPLAPVNDKRFTHGLRSWNDRWIHITRDVGNLNGIRINCRPEVSLLIV